MPADDYIDLILARDLGLTPDQIAALPPYVRVFAAELLRPE